MPPRKRAEPDPRGPVERAVAQQIADLDVASEKPGLAASALVLARKLDTDAGLATAAVARELRVTLEALARPDEIGGEGDVRALLDRLSAPLLD